MVPKLDRLARSVPDARTIGDSPADRGIRLSLGGQAHDPTDPAGARLFTALGLLADFESELARLRIREGMIAARAKGKLRGRPRTLSVKQQVELCRMRAAGGCTIDDLAELFRVSRPTCIAPCRARCAAPAARGYGSVVPQMLRTAC